MIKWIEYMITQYGWLFRDDIRQKCWAEQWVVNRIERRRIAREDVWLKDRGWYKNLSFWYGTVRVEVDMELHISRVKLYS